MDTPWSSGGPELIFVEEQSGVQEEQGQWASSKDSENQTSATPGPGSMESDSGGEDPDSQPPKELAGDELWDPKEIET